MHNREKGSICENFAGKYLEKHGYPIIARNYTIRGGEIDIICKKDEAIVFVEVKSLTCDSHINLAETITNAKNKSLIRTCNYWLTENEKQDCDWRIDFIGICTKQGRIKKLVHLERAIY